MNLGGAGRQKSEQLELALDGGGEALESQCSGEAPTARSEAERSGSGYRLMETVVERANAGAAWRRVRQNRGSPGIDGMNHDLLMGRLAKRIGDRRVLGLIRRYLEAGIMSNGVVVERHEGTPQGGPLSPLLANVLLDEVDRELEKRGHAFCRYADDCNVYVRSRRAGERVMETLMGLFARLRLRINPDKSAVARVWERTFLGFSFGRPQGG